MELVNINSRKQLTLFITESKEIIEKIRAEFNPQQHQLIAAHVTLCRENELENLDEVINRLKSINFKKPLIIKLETVITFCEGKGVMIPASKKNEDFFHLRKLILDNDFINEQEAHITLMHPRNSSCNPKLFDTIKSFSLPNELSFSTVSLIEQINGGVWKTLKDFKIVE